MSFIIIIIIIIIIIVVIFSVDIEAFSTTP